MKTIYKTLAVVVAIAVLPVLLVNCVVPSAKMSPDSVNESLNELRSVARPNDVPPTIICENLDSCE